MNQSIKLLPAPATPRPAYEDYDRVKEISLIDFIFSRNIRVYQAGKRLRKCSCPFGTHNDSNPSLTIYPDNTFWCFGCRTGVSIIDFVCHLDRVSPQEAVNTLKEYLLLPAPATTPTTAKYPSRKSKSKPHKSDRIDTTIYQYVTYQVLRKVYLDELTDKGKPAKSFPQRHQALEGEEGDAEGWVWNLHNVLPRLYKQDEILSLSLDTIIAVVEGEKCVEALLALGIPATTNSGGALNFPKELSYLFLAYKVVIFADNDSQGRQHAKQVQGYLAPYADKVAIAKLPLTKDGEDIADFIAAGHKAEEIRLIMEEALAAAEEAVATVEVETQQDSENDTESEDDTERESNEKHRFHADELSQLPPVEYLQEPYLQRNCLEMLVGESEVGKSFFAVHFGLTVAQFANVLYIPTEDPYQFPERVAAWRAYYRPEHCNFWLETCDLSLMDDTNTYDLIKANDDLHPTLVIIDTLHAASETANENSSQDIGTILRNARRIQKHWSCTVLIIHHLNKAGLAERGNSALKAGVRIQMQLSKEGDGVRLTYPKYRIGKRPTPEYFRWQQSADSIVPVPADGSPNKDKGNLSDNDLLVLNWLALEDNRNLSHANKSILTATELPERSLSYCLGKLRSAGFVVQTKEKGPWQVTQKGVIAVNSGKR